MPADRPLIFVHYGYSDYLPYTLRCARTSNPHRRLILLGDRRNRRTAIGAGWEHEPFEDFGSAMLDDFHACFRRVQGPRHGYMKNGRDWLKFVFQRWFHIESFLRAKGIKEFWHFDSDTMVLHDLSRHDHLLDAYEFSVQCDGTCLNGFAHAGTVTRFCGHMLHLFHDEDFLAAQQAWLDREHPDWAFTEMRAFQECMLAHDLRNFVRLLDLPGDVVFDECLAQSQGFATCTLADGDQVKHLTAKGGRIFGMRDGRLLEFASLALSWQGVHVFRWVWDARQGRGADIREARETVVSKTKAILQQLRARASGTVRRALRAG